MVCCRGHKGTGCPHIFLCDVPDIIHIFDIALVLNGSNCNGLFTHFGGDVLLHFDAQFSENQVSCRETENAPRVILPRAPPSNDCKSSTQLRAEPAWTWQPSNEPCRWHRNCLSHQVLQSVEFCEQNVYVSTGTAH